MSVLDAQPRLSALTLFFLGALLTAGCSCSPSGNDGGTSDSGDGGGAGGGGGGTGGGGGGTGGGGEGAGGGGGAGGGADAGLPPATGTGACPTQGPFGACAGPADCSDSVFCDGTEQCVDGGCVADPNPVCTAPQKCNESTRTCAQCGSDADCDDGVWCNGPERCVAGACQPATAAACPSTRSCNETTHRCFGCTTNADCDDGLWCNGAETCANNTCSNAPFKPCLFNTCDEPTHTCGCSSSNDCDDTVFCNGAETCVANKCVAGTYPCTTAGLEVCNEGTQSCTAGTIQKCATDTQCSDNVFCDGIERCSPGAAGANGFGCLPSPGNPCPANSRCVESPGYCLSTCPDADGDGHHDVRCGGDDCDDNDINRFPGNPEFCGAGGDSHDEDCDPLTFGSFDGDNDGHVSSKCCNVDVNGVAHCGDDCDDSNPAVHPGATEVCNGLDDNCNHQYDEGLLVSLYHDDDGDGAGAAGCQRLVCPGTPGFVSNADDCDDTRAALGAGAQACGQGGDPGTIWVCDPGGTWRATACPSGKQCTPQPNGTALCL